MGRNARRAAAVGTALVMAGALTGCDQWIKELASVNAAGTDSGNNTSVGTFREDGDRYFEPVLSADGSTLVFVSAATDLVPGGSGSPGNGMQVFARDLVSGTTTLVSMNAAGTGSGAGISGEPSVSADGTRVAFRSEAPDFGPPDPRFRSSDIYVRDLVTGTTMMASVNTAGTAGGNQSSTNPVISPDGTRVLFTSRASDLVGHGVRSGENLFVRDLGAGTTEVPDITLAGRGSSVLATQPAFSPDSSRVAFVSTAGDLVAGDVNGVADVFIRDLVADETTAVTVDAAGVPSGGGGWPTFGPVGNVLAYHRSGLVVEDLDTGAEVVVAAAGEPVFSPDGTKVAFASHEGSHGPPDTNDRRDIYVRDLVTGQTHLVSANAAGTNGGNEGAAHFSQNDIASFSADGTRVAFTSRSRDLGPTDTNVLHDIYVRDLTIGVTSLVSSNADGTNGGNGPSLSAVFRPGTDEVVFYSEADDLGPLDSRAATGQARGDIYVARIAPPEG
jgi:Tol biopolymer transport system component